MLKGVEYLTGAKSDSVLYSQLVGPTCGGLSAVAVKYDRVEASARAGELSTALGWTIWGKGTYGLGRGMAAG